MINLSPNNKEIYKLFKNHKAELKKFKKSVRSEHNYPSTYGLSFIDILDFSKILFMSEKEVKDALNFLMDLDLIVYNTKDKYYYYNDDTILLDLSPDELKKLLSYDYTEGL